MLASEVASGDDAFDLPESLSVGAGLGCASHRSHYLTLSLPNLVHRANPTVSPLKRVHSILKDPLRRPDPCANLHVPNVQPFPHPSEFRLLHGPNHHRVCASRVDSWFKQEQAGAQGMLVHEPSKIECHRATRERAGARFAKGCQCRSAQQ